MTKPSIRLAAVGDIVLNKMLANPADCEGGNGPFGKVLDTWANSDLVFGNLEGPTSTVGTPLDKFCVNSPPRTVDLMADAGFNIVSLANNHIFDYGYDGFHDTCVKLEQKKIVWFGAGKNLSEATKPAIFEVKGLKVGFLAYSWSFIGSLDATPTSPGCAPLRKHLILQNVAELRKHVDYIIVSVHWSYKSERYPLPYQRRMAHDIVDGGADLILGHHPHVIAGVEKYKHGIIAYSLGNFIFPEVSFRDHTVTWKQEHNESMVFQCTLSAEGIKEWSIIPVQSDRQCRPVPQVGHIGANITKMIQKLSLPLNRKDYPLFWLIHRTRKDLPQVRELNLYYRLKITIYRLFRKAFRIPGKIFKIIRIWINWA